MSPPTGPRTGGRLRSVEAHDAVMKAAVELLEEAGYPGVTIEGVAERAQVAKSTIYRWWPSKGALVMDAYSQVVTDRMPRPDSGAIAEDLTRFVTELYRVTSHPGRAQALRTMMVEAQRDRDFAIEFRRWVGTRRDVLAGMLVRAVDRRELASGLDIDYAVDQVFGPFWYRLMVGHGPLRAKDAETHVAQLIAGWRRAKDPDR